MPTIKTDTIVLDLLPSPSETIARILMRPAVFPDKAQIGN
jgi:hypothetical protein